MSEIKALEELRKLKGEVVDYRWGVDFDRAVDALEAEIAERFCEIPVDSNGVPCKCGDEVRLTGEDERLMVCGYTVDTDGFVSLYCSKLKDGRRWFPTVMTLATEVEHVKPRTVEDVLRDVVALCARTWKDEKSAFKFYDVDNVMESGNIADYADEIRNLIGGENA